MRNFLFDCEPDENGEIRLKNDDFHYFSRVLRKKIGDKFSATLQSGENAECEIVQIGKDEMTVKIFLQEKKQEADFCPIWLLQFLPKLPRFELIARQAAETGVEKIIAVSGDFSNGVGLNNTKIARLEKIVKEARQQSGSRIATEICAAELDDALQMVERATKNFNNCAKIVFSEKNAAPLSEVLTEKCDFAVVAVGCEGGFSENEFAKLLKSGFSPVHFRTNILRVETAAIYGIAAVQTRLTTLDDAL